MMHQLRFILGCSLLLTVAIAIEIQPKSESSAKLSASDDVSSAALPFETSHKIHHEFHTSHKISPDAFQRRADLHQSMRSKEKPELDEQLAELIAADIKNNIEAKRLSEYEKYVIEPLTEKPSKSPTVAQSVNEGLIDDDEFAILEGAGSENKQQSRIQIKKGPNGQDYEYEYVYYYYDDDESKNPGDSDVIVANRKPPSPATTTTPLPPTTQPPSSGKIRYSSVERGTPSSSSGGERNEIQSRGKARSQVLPAPVVEEIVDERLPPVTRFPQRSKTAQIVETAAPAQLETISTGKKHHPKRPSLELVDSHIFLTDEKDKNSQQGPRIVEETEISKSDLYESVSKQSIAYSSSTTESSLQSLEEETTPLMEKVAFDLYAHIVNENAKEEDKKSVSLEVEPTTIAGDELTTLPEEITTVSVPSTTQSTTTTTTTTTEAPTTTTETVLAKGRGALSAGRNSNRFKFQGKERTTTTTEAPVESTSVKNRFNRPSFGSSSRTSGSRFSKTTPAANEEVKETVSEKSEAPKPSSNKFKSNPVRNRFNLRASTEKPLNENGDSESTTASRLIRPSRPQFSLRNRGKPSPSTTDNAAPVAVTESNDEQESNTDKPTEKASIAPRPTSRLNINRPANRANISTSQTANKIRPSPLNRSRGNANTGENNNGDGRSTNENESDPEATTQNNLNKLKSRPRIQINADSKVKKSSAAPVINRKANPLISKRKFGASTTEATVDEQAEHEGDSNAAKDATNESEEHKDEETTQPSEVTSEQPARGLGLLNRRKLANNRRPGTLN